MLVHANPPATVEKGRTYGSSTLLSFVQYVRHLHPGTLLAVMTARTEGSGVASGVLRARDIASQGIGELKIQLDNGSLAVRNVHYVPEAQRTILSLGRLHHSG
jgi:hypothetical protein